ncbi:hypothetical protein [Latilactobacillus fragifolii]|uniref:hypothetical protein n=1 Tax=Latilactobacillus fragifolii TaxID=2814244 RepID=UPI001ABB87B5|nr:hypothetical protein [Latilactobacillus fragifolii]
MTSLTLKHLRLSDGNIAYLDGYIQQHELVSNYSEALRDILMNAELNDTKTEKKNSAIGKEVSILLEMLKEELGEAAYDSAKEVVESRIKRQVTKNSNPKKTKVAQTELQDTQTKQDTSSKPDEFDELLKRKLGSRP